MSGEMERYLADRMSAAEAAAFEARCETDPAFAASLEETLRLREGLKQLEDSGRLGPLLDEPWWKRHKGLQAIAATLVLAVFGGWWVITTQTRTLMFASAPDLPLVETRMLVHLRGGSEPAEVTLPLEGALELRILPDGESPNGQWQVRMSPGGAELVLAENAAGQIVVYLDGRELEPGPHVFEIRPGDGNAVERFPLQVRRSTP